MGNSDDFISINVSELISEGIISEQTASDIRTYYNIKPVESRRNKAVVVLSIIGALLIGTGINLVIAYNWEAFSLSVKTVFGFMPLLLAQALVVYTLWRRPGSIAWREGSGILLFLSVGATISLVAQIYNLYGDFFDFWRIWMILCLGISYIVSSRAAYLLSLIGLVVLAYSGEFTSQNSAGIQALGMSVLLFPFLIWQLRSSSSMYLLRSAAFFSAACLFAILPVVNFPAEFFYMMLSLVSIMGILIAAPHIFNSLSFPLVMRSLKLGGMFAAVVFVFTFAFSESTQGVHLLPKEAGTSLADFPVFYISIGCFLAYLGAIVYSFRLQFEGLKEPEFWIAPSLLLILFTAVLDEDIAFVFGNLLMFGLGLSYTILGLRRVQTFLLNFGLFFLISWIAIRFFDLDISFLTKGIFFILMGIGFIAANVVIHRKRIELKEETEP